MEKVIMKQGLYLEVKSSENDRNLDSIRTVKYKNIDKIHCIKQIVSELFADANVTPFKGIGNIHLDNHQEAKGIIIDYLINNDKIFDIIYFDEDKKINALESKINIFFKDEEEYNSLSWKDWIKDYFEESEDSIQEYWIDTIMEINKDLLGVSQMYFSRVAEECTAFKVESDIKVKII